ncbi:hypothetical protein RD055328_12910 [Companilactobacillus sp. RD055328]|uniref:immunoglobulin-like domain-containing protein n=1 Tax=Companilactobacillus sp. RD055328 TaxID=2916634 RepID=UPI001FC81FA4|nr:immunoglobulin-like domain-containing protein [Companilactobacillus sp. RD055328]GKQ43368.1 hypothetical protein RD055328_12910 [Companilactobacillus sp. RD055328]
MAKKLSKTVKIATYGAMLATLGTTVVTPVQAATSSNTEVSVQNASSDKENAVKKSGVTTTDSSANSNSETKQDSVVAKPTDLNLITWGKMTYSGDADKGLHLADGVTTGTLGFQTDIQSIASIGIADKTYYRVKLPEEFRELAKTDAFRRALSGHFRAWNLGIPWANYTYKSEDIRVDTVNNELIFNDPALSVVIGLFPHVTLDMSVDLGKAITESGVRIADSHDGYYHFQSALAGNNNVIDWTLGNRDSHVDIPLQKMDPGYGDTAPVIQTDGVNTTVPMNSNFDDAAALKGVKAWDKEEGFITNKLKVVSNQVNTKHEGYYPVTYSVTDSVGLKTTKTINFHVTKEAAKDYSLAPNTYHLGDANLNGVYGKDVYKVRLFVNGKVVAQASTHNGTFTFKNANKYVTSKNQNVQVVAVDKAYKEQNRKNVVITGDDPSTNKDYSLTPNSYKIGNSTLTGKYGKDVYKVRLFVNGKVVAQATTNNGTFTFKNANKFVTSKNQKVEVVAVDRAYKEQNRKSVSVSGDTVKDYALTANTYALGSSTLNGTYGKDVYKVRLFVNGKVVAQARTKNGSYTFSNVNKYVTQNNDQIKVVAVNTQYQQVNSINVNTTGNIVHDYKLTAKDYVLGQKTMTGTYGKDIAHVRVVVNGEVVKQADNNNGSWTAKGLIGLIKKGDKVQVVGVDSQYKQRASVDVKVSETNPNNDYSLTAPQIYKVGQSSMSGTYGKDIKAVRLLLNGEPVKNASLNTANHTYELKGLQYLNIPAGAYLQVVGVDSNYNTVVSKTVTAVA